MKPSIRKIRNISIIVIEEKSLLGSTREMVITVTPMPELELRTLQIMFYIELRIGYLLKKQ